MAKTNAIKNSSYTKIITSFLVVILYYFALISSSFALPCDLIKGEIHKVVEIIDGDTVILDDKSEVRFVGIQAPKLPLNRKNFKKWPLADEAKAELEKLLLNKNVTLYYPTNRRDRHNRILAHLYLSQNDMPDMKDIWVQNYMIKKGLARVYSFSDNRLCAENLLGSEKLAREQNLGIWKDDYYKILSADDEHTLSTFKNTFQLIEGKIYNVAKFKSVTYINFKEDWRRDFTIEIANKYLKEFKKYGYNILEWKDRNIRVRGWLTLSNGPKIDVNHPEQIEIIEVN